MTLASSSSLFSNPLSMRTEYWSVMGHRHRQVSETERRQAAIIRELDDKLLRERRRYMEFEQRVIAQMNTMEQKYASFERMVENNVKTVFYGLMQEVPKFSQAKRSVASDSHGRSSGEGVPLFQPPLPPPSSNPDFSITETNQAKVASASAILAFGGLCPCCQKAMENPGLGCPCQKEKARIRILEAAISSPTSALSLTSAPKETGRQYASPTLSDILHSWTELDAEIDQLMSAASATVDIDVKQKNTDVQDQARPPKRKTVPSETTCDDTDPSSTFLSFKDDRKNLCKRLRSEDKSSLSQSEKSDEPVNRIPASSSSKNTNAATLAGQRVKLINLSCHALKPLTKAERDARLSRGGRDSQ